MELGVKILFKNKYFVVINKQPDLVINSNDPSRPSLQKKLVELFSDEVSQSPVKFGVYFPHRLDFATSGVMCVALDKKSCAAASAAFQNHISSKFYLALVRGHVSQSALEIDAAIGEKEEGDPVQRMKVDGIKARSAVTRMLVLDRGFYQSQPVTKVLLKPLTGRRHQLRVHCHSIGFTIVGDYTYSNGVDSKPPRMFLHSYRLKLPNHLTDLDVKTEDPFTEDKILDWVVSEPLHLLSEKTMTLMADSVLWQQLIQ